MANVLTQTGMTLIQNGKVNDKNIQVKLYPSIEHGKLSGITSIVLHRTAGYSAISSLNGYVAGQKTGAHFLIDKSGHIYQTAGLDKVCWHVGIMYARCEIEKSCDPKELATITSLLHTKGMSFGKRVRSLSRHETAKKYPLRYPSNMDSIGIEVVGRFNKVSNTFEKPSNQQFKSIKWLVELLVDELGLNLRNDVYAHGVIARKKKAEGVQLLQYLFTGVAQ